jgi:hypothetical protein
MIALGEKATGELEYGLAGAKKVIAPMFLDGTVLAEPPADPNVKEAAPAKNAPPPAPSFSRREWLAGWGSTRRAPTSSGLRSIASGGS